MEQTIVLTMEGSPKKEKSVSEIDLSQISTLKRVSDLIPKGFNQITNTQNLPNAVSRIISESSLTKYIPNLANPTLQAIPRNSIASQITEQNAQLQKATKNQLQHTFMNRIRPFNFLTLILAIGWVITMLLLNFL